MKKNKFLLLIFLLIIIVASILIFRKQDSYVYFVSLILLISGLISYPVNYKFREKKDFMVFPLLVVVIFNIINLFYLKNYTGKMALVNTLMGLYGFLQCLYYKNKSQ